MLLDYVSKLLLSTHLQNFGTEIWTISWARIEQYIKGQYAYHLPDLWSIEDALHMLKTK